MLFLCAGLLIWMTLRLYEVNRWLVTRRETAPDADGVWGELIARIARIRRSKRKYKQRSTGLLKEFRKLTRAIPDGGVLLNGDWEIQAFNPVAARMLALKKIDRRGRRIDNLIRAPEFIAYLRDAKFAKPVVVMSPVDDQLRLSMQVFAYGEGQSLLIIKDVTEQFRLEKIRRDFVANASHELRSPLTVIVGYLDSLGSDLPKDSDLERPIAEMQKQAARMQGLVRDLLQLSRLENGHNADDQEWVDMASLIGVARKDCLARFEGVDRVEFDYQRGWFVYGVAADLQSVVVNLLENAIKYTPPGGVISVSWHADENGGLLTVRDEGIGIAAEDIPRLTERFFRVDAGRSREQGGTGLGLAIVKHVLNRHGAKMAVQSELGVGSCFTCHFPASRVREGRGDKVAEL